MSTFGSLVIRSLVKWLLLFEWPWTCALREAFERKGIVNLEEEYNLEEAQVAKISDHYPVYAVFNINKWLTEKKNSSSISILEASNKKG